MDNREREEMILNNLGLVGSIVSKRFPSSIYEKEDLFMVGVEGLIKAVDTYDINKNTKFAGYAYSCIYNEIAKMIKVDSRHYKPSYNISYNTENTDFLVDYNAVESIESNYFKSEDIDVINKLIKKINLSVRDINIAKMYFGFDGVNYTQREIGNLYNMSHTNVQLIIKKFLREITKLLLEEYGNDYIRKKQKDVLLKL